VLVVQLVLLLLRVVMVLIQYSDHSQLPSVAVVAVAAEIQF
jgi:hypothetical protein